MNLNIDIISFILGFLFSIITGVTMILFVMLITKIIHKIKVKKLLKKQQETVNYCDQLLKELERGDNELSEGN